MFGWLRKSLKGSAFPTVKPPPGFEPSTQPFVWPANVRHVASRADVGAMLVQERAVVLIFVDWSIQAHWSREVFAEFVRCIEQEHLRLGLSFWVLRDDSEGIQEWFEAVQPPAVASTGYGAVIWLQRGVLAGVEEYAAAVGVEGLVRRTGTLWQA